MWTHDHGLSLLRQLIGDGVGRWGAGRVVAQGVGQLARVGGVVLHFVKAVPPLFGHDAQAGGCRAGCSDPGVFVRSYVVETVACKDGSTAVRK